MISKKGVIGTLSTDGTSSNDNPQSPRSGGFETIFPFCKKRLKNAKIGQAIGHSFFSRMEFITILGR
jgi:hypothetical protein